MKHVVPIFFVVNTFKFLVLGVNGLGEETKKYQENRNESKVIQYQTAVWLQTGEPVNVFVLIPANTSVTLAEKSGKVDATLKKALPGCAAKSKPQLKVLELQLGRQRRQGPWNSAMLSVESRSGTWMTGFMAEVKRPWESFLGEINQTTAG